MTCKLKHARSKPLHNLPCVHLQVTPVSCCSIRDSIKCACSIIDVNYVLSITFVVGRTTRKSSRKSFYVPFTPLLRLQHVQEIPSHSKLKAHP